MTTSPEVSQQRIHLNDNYGIILHKMTESSTNIFTM
jgi:hypothetical protein